VPVASFDSPAGDIAGAATRGHGRLTSGGVTGFISTKSQQQ
jgi:hypothetical protein